jgi:sialic acid synthase SpsE
VQELIKQHKTLFLPDIGTFFNEDVDLALKMVNHLVKSGIPVIKGEVLHDVNICLNSDLSESYYSPTKGKIIKENYRDLIERKVISLDVYSEIFAKIRAGGCELILSVYDNEGVDFSIDQNVVAIKIASSNITHKSLLEYVAKTDRTIIVDTGHSTMEEISRAINWLNDAGKSDIIIQHSPLAPPISVEEHNLKFMKTLGECFQLPFGLSDHHIGEEMLYAATALGACIVEKGVCPDEMEDDQDRAHALNISEVKLVQQKIKNIAKGLGNGVIQLHSDREKYHSRMGLIAKKEIFEGDILSDLNIGFAFPRVGLGVEDIELALGKKANRSILIGQPISLFDI